MSELTEEELNFTKGGITPVALVYFAAGFVGGFAGGYVAGKYL
ncbi:class IIb bacteriocin, lactobin A/cerein 7B family [Dapis sp. BLCC M229]